jgi:hypothetical protein
MLPVLDYSREASIPRRCGWPYYVLFAINSISLSVGLSLFSGEISGDVYAPFLGLMYGVPLLLAQVLFGTMPAWMYLGRTQMNRWPRYVLLALSTLPSVLGAVGVVLSFALPRTHGSGC